MPRFEVLVPTVEIKCFNGHLTQVPLSKEFAGEMNNVLRGCKQCAWNTVDIRWVGMKPTYIEGEKE